MGYFFNSWAAGIASFMTGVFIDVDHLLDYFIECGINLDVKRFFEVYEKDRYKRAILILHSHELVVGLWIAILFMDLGVVWKGAAIGLTQHILFDQFLNFQTKAHKLRYSFLYRLKKGFDRKVFIEDEKNV